MTPLQDQLDEITANTRNLVQAERLAVGERAVEELFATGMEERILPVGAMAPEFALKDSNGKVVRSADLLGAGSAGDQVLSRAVVPLLHDGARGVARSLWTVARARSPDGRDRAADPAAERLHGRPAWTSLPGADGPEQLGRRAVRAGLHGARVSPRLLPLDPREYSVREWREELAPPSARDIRSESTTGRVVLAEAHADFRVRPEPEEALAAAFAAKSR